MADRHLVVRKRVERGRTITDVLPLEGGERVEEGARMLGGETITESARRHVNRIRSKLTSAVRQEIAANGWAH